MHKEELGVSETERRLKKRIEENARLQQRKKSAISSGDSNNRDRANVPSSPPSNVCVRYTHTLHCNVCMNTEHIKSMCKL